MANGFLKIIGRCILTVKNNDVIEVEGIGVDDGRWLMPSFDNDGNCFLQKTKNILLQSSATVFVS